jgi:hypothetical protein
MSSPGNLAGSATAIQGQFTFQSDNPYPTDSANAALANWIGLSQVTYDGPLSGIAINHGIFRFVDAANFVGGGTVYCADCTIGGEGGLKGGFVAAYTIQGTATTYTGMLTFIDGFKDLRGITGGGTFEGNCVDSDCTKKGSLGHYDFSYTLPPPAPSA